MVTRRWMHFMIVSHRWCPSQASQTDFIPVIIAGPACRTLIFAKSKPMVDKIDDFLYHKGMPVTSLHSERSQLEREDSMYGALPKLLHDTLTRH